MGKKVMFDINDDYEWIKKNKILSKDIAEYRL